MSAPKPASAPAASQSIFARPLRLGSHTLTRRKSDAANPGPPPDEPIPPVPALRHKPSHDMLDRPAPSGPISPTSQLSPTLPLEPRSPGFRVLPPMSNPASYSHSKNPSWATPSAYSHEMREYDLSQEAPPVFVHRTDATERRRLQTELRLKPLHQSVYGRAIVSLLMVPWVVAPSGLAACILESPKDLSMASDIASYINLLVCGAEAFASPYADILAVHQLGHLNRWLSKSGLSPIQPGPLPQPWLPLNARQPPPFLLEGFRVMPNAQPHDMDSNA